MEGKEFRKLRKGAGLLQREVADELRISRETVLHWERRSKGTWDVPYAYSVLLKQLVCDSDRVAAIRAARPPRKKVTFNQRMAGRVKKIRAAGGSRD